MINIQDHTGNFISIPSSPQRIVSLVPSITELLYDLNLGDRVVGITKFCLHPEQWFKDKPKIGGTKNIHIAKIQELQPDLIIANKEENVKEQIALLQQFCPVFTTMIDTVASATQMIRDIGLITSTTEKENEIADRIFRDFSRLQPNHRIPTVYLIWKAPYMSVGGDTFISDMMQYAGFDNMMKKETRYPIIDEYLIQQLNPELILLSSEPYPFKDKHIDELQTICPAAKIMLVDGEIFSWYGSRMLLAFNYFEKLRQKINCIDLV